MNYVMTFPNTVEEFMEEYKIVDSEHVYTNGTEMVPIFRMKQWFEHRPERKRGTWTIEDCHATTYPYCCSNCTAHHRARYDFCPTCGADMRGDTE